MKKIYIFALVVLIAKIGIAQKGIVGDRIIAIIGDKIILESDIKNRLDDMKRSGAEIPANAQCLMLETMLSSKALSQQAIKDSLPVSDEEIETSLDLKVRQFAAQFGSIEALEQVAGKTVFQLKEDSRESIREQKLAEEMQKEIMRGVKITPTEVKAYFEKISKDSLSFYEAQVEVGQIVIIPKAQRDIIQFLKDDLNEYKKSVLSGAKKFEILAKTYSEDPGTKNDGGLFTFKRTESNVDADFKAASLKLKNAGDITPIIKSSFGYHIIQLVSKKGDDITVRHILRIPEVTDDEYTKTMEKLDTVRSNLIANTMKWGEAVARFSEDDYSKYTGGMIINPEDGSTFITIDKFPDKDLVLMLKKLKLGQFSAPSFFTDQRGKKGVRIVYLKTQLPAHQENIRDDYSKIANRATEEKKGDVMEAWINKKLPTYYLQVDNDFKDCGNIQRWVAESAKIK
jgi:peptidyl-prolyl cis-trans isomerase SurA